MSTACVHIAPACNYTVLQIALKRRMPHLVNHWFISKNVSLEQRKSVNQGYKWVLIVILEDEDATASGIAVFLVE